jgi:uncharacterized protein (TIGR00375 family)
MREGGFVLYFHVMRIIADLHIHSRFSRATSSRLNLAYLDRWAQIKGIQLLGTGDCTHPRWLAELREQLDEGEEGFYTLKDMVRAEFDAGPAREEGMPRGGAGAEGLTRFVLTGEISTIYKSGGVTRKVHHVIILPDFKAAAVFQTKLERMGNISSDGRPILGIDSRNLLTLLLDADDRALLIPAHIWTPWFSVLGARSGFDSVEECYGDLTSRIPAVETGLSSNPPMNWALSTLDKFSIISNSDAHSPDKLGREATIFDMEPSYPSLAAALWRRGGSAGGGIAGTIEFFPQEGKYHYDGHRKCGCWLEPEEAAAAGGLCPVCGKALTRGVMGRVLELADRPVDETQAAPEDPGGGNRRPYRSLIPLREILGELLETGAASKKVEALYGALVEKSGGELGFLMDLPLADIEGFRFPGLSGELLAAAVGRMRSGQVSISPGYDGEYGVIRAFGPGEQPALRSQTELFTDGAPSSGPPETRTRGRPLAGAAPRAQNTPGTASALKTALNTLNTGTQPRPAPFRLNDEQEKVAAWQGKQAIIIAGPGTGKTATLAARISRLAAEGIEPRSILALSFTIKAAAELEERIRAAVGEKAAGITAATFHSFCLSLLKEQAGKHGVPKDFRIAGEGERESLLQKICAGSRKAAAGKKRNGFQRLGEYIERRKRFLLLPGESLPKFGGPGFEPLIRLAEELGIPETEPDREKLYGRYRDRLRLSGLLDFDDLVVGTVRLLGGNREQLLAYRSRFRFIFVDEYQDINFAQYALIRLLTGEAEDLFPYAGVQSEPPFLWVIGDPNQAIYGFRGSDRRFIERFLNDYPGAGEFHLSQSFRCAVPIIKAAGRLMDTRLRGLEREVTLFRHEYPTEKAEAEGIARRVSRLIGGASFFAIDSEVAAGDDGSGEIGDMAILLRSAALAPSIMKGLRDHGIPFEFTGEKPWWEEEPVRTVLNALGEYETFAGERGFTAKTPAEAIRGAWESARKSGKAVGEERGPPESLERLLGLAVMYDDLFLLLEDLAVRGAGDLPEIRREGVRVMTIHASKGLEFDHVFIAGLEEGLLPFTLYGEQDIEEERRLLYVALTRARRGLYLSSARTRYFQGRKIEAGPSRFLAELETLIPLGVDYPSRPKNPQLNLF